MTNKRIINALHYNMNDNTKLFMIRAKLETLKITLQEEPLTSIVQDIQDDITELIHENSMQEELNNPVKPIDDEQDRRKEISDWMIKLADDNKELLKEFDTLLDSWINSKGLNKSETPSKEDKEETEPLNVFNSILDTWITLGTTELFNKNPLICEHKLFKELNELETPSKEDEVDTEKIKEWMDKIVKNRGLTYELYNDEYTIDSTTKTQSNYLKDLFKDYR